jgi:hypothetical protein
VLNNERNPLYGINKVKIHSHFETLEHFVSKAILTYLLFKNNNGTITEAEMRNGRSIDVLSVNDNENYVGYELESNGHNSKPDVEGVDIIEIDLRKMPDTAKKGMNDLMKWLEEFIV